MYVKLKGVERWQNRSAHEKKRLDLRKFPCPARFLTKFNQTLKVIRESAANSIRFRVCSGDGGKRQLNVAFVAYCNTVLVSLSFAADLGPRLVKGLDYSTAHWIPQSNAHFVRTSAFSIRTAKLEWSYVNVIRNSISQFRKLLESSARKNVHMN